MRNRFDLHLGDCLEVMPTLAADSVDSIVSDPPYGLSFMGKGWDHGVPGQSFWAEALRVAKPGAHLLAFGGTRTYHRLACAIEDAGWEIRDCVMWVYGSGFPKSLDVGKAIDKRGGSVAAFEHFRDAVKSAMKTNGVSRQTLQDALGNHMLSHYLTSGSQPAVPNVRDYRIIRDAVGMGNEWDALFVDEAEREVVGEKPWNNSASHFVPGEDHTSRVQLNITGPATDAAREWHGWGTALKPAWEPIIVARKPLVGTVAENVLTHGTGGINVDGCRVATDGEDMGDPSRFLRSDAKLHEGWQRPHKANGEKMAERAIDRFERTASLGRWPANVIHDGSEEVVGLFPQAAPAKAADRGAGKGETGCYGVYGGNPGVRGHNDAGGSAARFFYCAKASKADRDEGLEDFALRSASECCEDREPGSAGLNNPRAGAGRTSGARNIHPTVKPTSLMRYLCRLVTPPNGIILDPFMVSGSTGKGAMLEGFRFIGIEREAEYLEIARARIDAATKSDNALPLFQEELACV